MLDIMTQPEYMFWIEAEGKGFFGCPTFSSNFVLPQSHGSDLACAFALDRAKGGDFSLVPSVADFYQTGSPQLDSMILGTIAYAGPASCFSRIVNVVNQDDDLRRILDYCGVMAERGELAYVPIFLDKYLANQRKLDAEYMTDYIRDLIGGDLYPGEPDVFRDQVLEYYRQMVERMGSEKTLVFRGHLYSVTRLAEYILKTVRNPFFRSSLRRSFEAATGIDCSLWYKNRSLQPLAVTAILEEFLESPEAVRYEEGVRYFFGHRIPD